VFFLALLLVGVLDSRGSDSGFQDLLVIGLVIILVRAIWRTFSWYREWFVGTDRRLMLTLGILTRKVAMIPLGKVTDMRYDRPPLGQLLGYGSFVLESAGQDQAFRVVHYVPHPDTLYRRISEELFTPSETRFLDRPVPGPKVLPVQEPTAPWWKRT
jgi:membrane protein YdbS with pleckstrin-like domain